MAKGKVYSVRQDKLHARKVNKILLSYPNISQKDLYRACITNWHRLKYLEEQGYINLQHTRKDHEQRTEENHTQI